VRLGSNQARSAIRFVRLPEAAAGTRGAIEISFMALTLVPALKKGERLERSFFTGNLSP